MQGMGVLKIALRSFRNKDCELSNIMIAEIFQIDDHLPTTTTLMPRESRYRLQLHASPKQIDLSLKITLVVLDTIVYGKDVPISCAPRIGRSRTIKHRR